MSGNVLAIVLGVLMLGLGLVAVSPRGLPISPQLAITGPAAKTIGAVLLLLGTIFMGMAIWFWAESKPGGA
jgi:hypothetical protein